MKNLIENQLWAYGFLPLLKVIEEMEKREEYDICYTILKVLKEHGKKFDWEIPTKFNHEAVIEMKIAFMTKFGLSGDIAHSNNDSYAEVIINKIEIYKQKTK